MLGHEQLRPPMTPPLDIGSELPPVPAEDLQRSFEHLPEAIWRKLDGRRIYITGGTGFLGKWLLATLLDVRRRLNMRCTVTVLSRRPDAFVSGMPMLATAPGVTLVKGDVCTVEPDGYHYDTIIHAATDVVAPNTPRETFDTCVEGTRRALAIARASGARDFLLVSSGAVYGRQPAELDRVSEDFCGAPDPLAPSSAYGEGKRVSEWLSCTESADAGFDVKIARCFAFVGPHLPLDKRFAIGNFIGAALDRRDLVIQGDGSPVRSYLYAADMAGWLWAVLLRGAHARAYNVGASEGLSIAELASAVCRALDVELPVHVLTPRTPDVPVQRYVPDNLRALRELELPVPIPLAEAIARTACWHGPLLRNAEARP